MLCSSDCPGGAREGISVEGTGLLAVIKGTRAKLRGNIRASFTPTEASARLTPKSPWCWRDPMPGEKVRGPHQSQLATMPQRSHQLAKAGPAWQNQKRLRQAGDLILPSEFEARLQRVVH